MKSFDFTARTLTPSWSAVDGDEMQEPDSSKGSRVKGM